MESWLTASGTPEEMEARQPLESCMQVLEPQRARELFLVLLRATLARQALGVGGPAGAREGPGWLAGGTAWHHMACMQHP